MCTPGKDSQTRIQCRNMYTYTHHVHTAGTGSPNQHAGQKDVHKHTNVHRVHKASIQGRKMFTNTQYVHRVNKPAYREERCSQTHNMFTQFTKPACRAERCSQTYNSQWEQCPGLPSNTNIIFVGWGSVIVQCDKINVTTVFFGVVLP